MLGKKGRSNINPNNLTTFYELYAGNNLSQSNNHQQVKIKERRTPTINDN